MIGKVERDTRLEWHTRSYRSSTYMLFNMRQYGDLTLISQPLTENVLELAHGQRYGSLSVQ